MDDDTFVIATNRLRLRQFEIGDQGFALTLLNEEPFLRYIGDKGVRDEQDAQHYLLTGPMDSYRRNGFGLMAVEDRVTGELLGMCGLLKREDQLHPDIGYAFLSEYHGRGLAFESAQAVLAHARSKLHIPTVLAFVDPDNERSIHLLEKLDMRCVGMQYLAGLTDKQKVFSTDAERQGSDAGR